MSKPIPHGTLRGYNYYRCRCQRCRDAKAAYVRERGYKDSPQRRVYKNRWERENGRHPCAVEGCAELVWRRKVLCRPHYEARISGQRDARRQRIADLWNDGATLAQIAEALNSTSGSIQVAMVGMRADGWDLPYRYARRREQVPA